MRAAGLAGIVALFVCTLLLSYPYLTTLPSLGPSELIIDGYLREEVHLHRVKQREKYLQPMRENKEIGTWDQLPNTWYLWEPTWSCPFEERVGKLGDGGKWLCGLRFLKSPCVVYSFGSNYDITFETDVASISQCEIHIFDPTVTGPPEGLPSRTTFHMIGISDHDGTEPIDGKNFPVKTLETIMKELGHTFIDIFKIDVEMAEWKVLPHLYQSGSFPFGQIVIELHYVRVDFQEIVKFFDKMAEADFRIFHRDPNLFWHLGQEYSLITKQETTRLSKLALGHVR